MTVEHPLALVGEDIQAASLIVLERRKQRIPPRVREVLSLVDNDGVESMTGLELCCKVGHLERKVVLPELHSRLRAQRFVGSFGRAPQHAQCMELTDIGRTLPPRPRGGDALKVRSEAMRVADECDALPFLREPAGLLHRQERLAAARSAAHLDAVEQPDGDRKSVV